jgi:hypothetical protein
MLCYLYSRMKRSACGQLLTGASKADRATERDGPPKCVSMEFPRRQPAREGVRPNERIF